MAYVGDRRAAYSIFIWRPEGKRLLEVDGRII